MVCNTVGYFKKWPKRWLKAARGLEAQKKNRHADAAGNSKARRGWRGLKNHRQPFRGAGRRFFYGEFTARDSHAHSAHGSSMPHSIQATGRI
jgi:hypothetical protein